MSDADDILQPNDIPDEETVEAVLLAGLYRQDCPETSVLGEYYLGLLAEADQSDIQTHLKQCPHCQGELDRLAGFMASTPRPAPPTSAGQEQRWFSGPDFEWLKEKTGAIVVRLRAVLEPPAASRLNPNAVRGDRTGGETEIVRRIKLGPEETDEFDLEITLRHSEDRQFYTLTVQAIVLSHWLDMAGTQVQARAGDWQVEGLTNEEGEVVFERLPKEEIETLVIEVNPD